MPPARRDGCVKAWRPMDFRCKQMEGVVGLHDIYIYYIYRHTHVWYTLIYQAYTHIYIYAYMYIYILYVGLHASLSVYIYTLYYTCASVGASSPSGLGDASRYEDSRRYHFPFPYEKSVTVR